MLLLPHFKSALAFGLILTNRLQGKRHVRLLSEVSRTSWLLLFPPDTPSQTYQEPTSASRNRKAYEERGAQSIPSTNSQTHAWDELRHQTQLSLTKGTQGRSAEELAERIVKNYKPLFQQQTWRWFDTLKLGSLRPLTLCVQIHYSTKLYGANKCHGVLLINRDYSLFFQLMQVPKTVLVIDSTE